MQSRSQRRHHLERMKAKARKARPWDEKARDANHLAACSCELCGNPRRWYGQVTVQELRAKIEPPNA